jgi:hypothetical protein
MGRCDLAKVTKPSRYVRDSHYDPISPANQQNEGAIRLCDCRNRLRPMRSFMRLGWRWL